jgi:serine/threonine protein kinase
METLIFKRELGSGGFGTVNLMFDKLRNQNVAVKFINFRQKNGMANGHLM